uniref:Uncharacterized protein n=1 Tax=Phlebotomus papatasi TaxID=29031 RepID=A0A1B0DGN3_PHLPP
CQKKFDEVQRNIYHHPEVETDEDFEKESLEQADFDDRVERGKWQTSQPNINIGDLVLLIEDNLPPLAWIHGRVTELHPGCDGITRVVTVRTSSGIYKRAITRVAPFPKEITDPEVDTSATGKMSQLAACSANFASAVNI